MGTTAQCVTGRLASLEEIVDWQPYDHVGWRLAVPELGPIEATADLEAVDGGTRVRLRWEYRGTTPIDAGVMGRVREEKDAAFGRLQRAIAGALPVVDERVVVQ